MTGGASVDVGALGFTAVFTLVVTSLAIMWGVRRRRAGPPTMAMAWWVLALSLIASGMCLFDLQQLWRYGLFLLVGGSLSAWELRRVIRKKLAEVE